jgi:hypothetical protein
MIVDAYNVTSLNACQDTDVCTTTVSSNTPRGPGQVAYAAAIGTDAAHVLAYNHNGCCFVSWLFHPKLYAFREPNNPPGFTSSVILFSDGGGDQPTGPWRISIFNTRNGALVQECQYQTLCTGLENNTSGAGYQTVVSLGGTDLNSALQNDARTFSSTKCVDPPDLTAPTFC